MIQNILTLDLITTGHFSSFQIDAIRDGRILGLKGPDLRNQSSRVSNQRAILESIQDSQSQWDIAMSLSFLQVSNENGTFFYMKITRSFH